MSYKITFLIFHKYISYIIIIFAFETFRDHISMLKFSQILLFYFKIPYKRLTLFMISVEWAIRNEKFILTKPVLDDG